MSKRWGVRAAKIGEVAGEVGNTLWQGKQQAATLEEMTKPGTAKVVKAKPKMPSTEKSKKKTQEKGRQPNPSQTQSVRRIKWRLTWSCPS